jgi:hypothetical protein
MASNLIRLDVAPFESISQCLTESGKRPFSAAHFLGHGFGLIPASCRFASSAFPVPP